MGPRSKKVSLSTACFACLSRRLTKGNKSSSLHTGKQVSIFSVQLSSDNKTGWGLANPVLSRTDACCEDFGFFSYVFYSL